MLPLVPVRFEELELKLKEFEPDVVTLVALVGGGARLNMAPSELVLATLWSEDADEDEDEDETEGGRATNNEAGDDEEEDFDFVVELLPALDLARLPAAAEEAAVPVEARRFTAPDAPLSMHVGVRC
jgi:hypothetical protein